MKYEAHNLGLYLQCCSGCNLVILFIFSAKLRIIFKIIHGLPSNNFYSLLALKIIYLKKKL